MSTEEAADLKEFFATTLRQNTAELSYEIRQLEQRLNDKLDNTLVLILAALV